MSGPQEQQREGLEAKPPTLCSNNCGFFSNPGCNGMCSMCYRKFAHTQPSKDPAPGTAASDLKVPATMPEGQPTKSLHSPHPSSSPDHANQALQSNISMAVPKTLLDDLPSQVVTGTPVVPERGCESSQPEKMEVDEQEVVAQPEAAEDFIKPRKKRCFACRKKVGPMGFRCRCNQIFCEQHRYPESHDCEFDHKAAERQKIQDDNPVIRSERVRRV